MKRTISMKAAVAVATVSVFAALAPVFAQEESEAAKESAEDAAVVAPAKPQKAFTQLVRCVRVEGTVQVLKPGAQEWVTAEEGRYYPLGSSFRAVAGLDGKVFGKFQFGEKATLTLKDAAEFGTTAVDIGEQKREVVLKSGRIYVSLPRTLQEGLFFVRAPFFACSNLAGDSQFDYAATGDGDEAVVRCVTGSMALEGRHYKVARMGVANQVRIRTTGDGLFSSLRGESGDVKMVLDQGMGTEKNFETGEVKDVPKSLEFALSPQCAIKIWRRKLNSGDRMAVSIMTFDPAGVMKNRCAFAEGLSNVNSGELVVAPRVVADVEKEKAKAESEETETVEAVAPKAKAEAAEKSDEEEKSDDKEEEKKDEKKDESDI